MNKLIFSCIFFNCIIFSFIHPLTSSAAIAREQSINITPINLHIRQNIGYQWLIDHRNVKITINAYHTEFDVIIYVDKFTEIGDSRFYSDAINVICEDKTFRVTPHSSVICKIHDGGSATIFINQADFKNGSQGFYTFKGTFRN